MAKYFYWPAFLHYLSTTRGDSTEIGPESFPCLSPLSSDVSKISMTGDVVPAQLIENVARNFLEHCFKVSTWRSIRHLYETVEKNPEDLTHQKLLEILLIFSKLSIDEYYEIYYKYREKDFPNASPQQFFEGDILRGMLDALAKLAEKKSIIRIENGLSVIVKEFLSQRSIIASLKIALAKVGISETDDWFLEKMFNMRIYFTRNLPNLNGITFRDGILISRDEPDLAKLLSDDVLFVKKKASFLTTAIHETCHYLARCANNDFNFSSPGAGSRFDAVIPNKSLELGRDVELILFGNIQPKFDQSSDEAAIDFLRNAKNFPNGRFPLIAQTTDTSYLKGRVFPSLSFAADFVDVDTTCIC